MMLAEKVVFIYDGDCGFCTKAAKALKGLDKTHKMEVVPFQTLSHDARSGISEEEFRQKAYLFSGNEKFAGASAINKAYSIAMGTGWAYKLYTFPVVRQIEDFVYTIVAKNRHKLPGGKPECKL
ncbi:MAG: DUF393 domain-containing protein [Leptospira sp.]|nr:DUF393 domain-containing protein [Leptospira sp.]